MPAAIFRLILTASSILMAFLCLYCCYTYVGYQKSGNRFFQIRTPYLTLSYFFCAAIPSLLVISPAEIHLSHRYIQVASSDIQDTAFSRLWMARLCNVLCTSFMLIVISVRSWLVVYDYYFVECVVNKNWQQTAGKTLSDFWLNHRKTWGNFGFVLLIGIITMAVITMLLTIVSIFVFRSKHLLYLSITSCIICMVCCTFMFALIRFDAKINKLRDAFQIMSEIKLLVTCTAVLCVLYLTEIALFAVHTPRPVRHLLHQTSQILFTFITCTVQSQWVVSQFRQLATTEMSTTELMEEQQTEAVRMQTPDSPKPTMLSFQAVQKQIELEMMDVLANEEGFEMFMRHCQAEFNVEALLFIVEVAWYQLQIFDVERWQSQPSLHELSSTGSNTISTDNQVAKHTTSVHIDGDDELEQEHIPGLTAMETQSSGIDSQSFGMELATNYRQIVKQLAVSFDSNVDRGDEEKRPPETINISDETANDSPPAPSDDERSLEWMYQRAKYLFVKYIDVESEFSINVSHCTREELLLFFMKDRVHGFIRFLDEKQVNVEITNFEQRIEDAGSQRVLRHMLYSMFDNAKHEIWALLSGDSFVRFMQTTEYQFLLQQHQETK